MSDGAAADQQPAAASSQRSDQAHGDREKFRQNAAPAGKIPKPQEDLPDVL
jgi:hypothetical protein